MVMGILVNIFTVIDRAIVSILVKVICCICASISLGYLEEESLSFRVSAPYILIHAIQMSVQIYSHGNKCKRIPFACILTKIEISAFLPS